ncbi:MAG: N-acetylmuramoyl-L-alanine amidase [Clostridia bacterium]|nr:N-acetylmuramoyl-L-alanine amidase [Clostridia bacterium]
MCKKRKRQTIMFALLIAALALVSTLRLAASSKQVAQPLPSVPVLSRIYLDPGHGGFDFGAVGKLPNGDDLAEKDLVLNIALTCGEQLARAGHEVLFSRMGEERLTNTTAADEVRARRASAKEQAADLIVSVHANAYAGEGRAYGARVYYNPTSPVSRVVAERIAAAITRHTGAYIGRECRTVADGTYYMVGDESMPAVLIELGFLSDERECALLGEGWYRTALATAIAEGVGDRDVETF